MKELIIVGVDVSKFTLDICFKPSGVIIKVTNNQVGFKQWSSKCKQLLQGGFEILVVMEHTGRYSLSFESFLRSKCIRYCKIPALHIKRSLGIIRGKNDKVDAQRIADYGWLRRETLTPDKPPVRGVEQLRQLLSLRSKLIRDRSGYICRLKEIKATSHYSKNDVVIRLQEKMIATLNNHIKMLEIQINAVIEAYDVLKKTAALLKTIKGVGDIVATYMIVCTDNFQRFRNARKFNCYAGLAPFRYESGISIRSRSRVSHLANKEAKTLLNLAACCSIRSDNELRQYYDKRLTEGKTRMACLNIIRSKLVARMFAVIKRQTPYQELPLAA
jgi:transposase